MGAPLGQPHTNVHTVVVTLTTFSDTVKLLIQQGETISSQQYHPTCPHSCKIPSWLEPSRLHRANGKHSDGMIMVSWSRESIWYGMPQPCVDTLCQSQCRTAATDPGTCLLGPHVLIPPSLSRDMWHHRSRMWDMAA